MATLQKIRNNAGLFVSIFIGFALLAFILGDLLRSGNTMFTKSKNEVAEIGGESVPIQVFQAKIDENVENYKNNAGVTTVDQITLDRLREQTWEQFVRELIMGEEYEDLGISVSGEELSDMVRGNNIDPQIKQIPIFQNKETGQFDRNLVLQFLKNMELDPSGKAQSSWLLFEKSLVDQKIDQKYNSLLAKGLYVTTLQTQKENFNKNYKVDFEYVKVALNTVTDSMINVSDDDLTTYYNEHKDEYQQDEAREINYVVFPIKASEQDDKDTKKWLADIKDEFSEIENVEQYVNLNSDNPFSAKYYAQDELPQNITNLYSSEAGSVYGPYKENESYKLAKVVKFENIPDSVNARHILIRVEASTPPEVAKNRADSLASAIKSGSDFAELAKTFSADGSAQKGGDLGWFTEGKMVKQFNDACFFGKKGDITVIESQFGVHVIEVLDQASKTKKVQIALIERAIVASSKTYQAIYSEASKFGGTNRTYKAFTDAAEKEGTTLRFASLKKDDKVIANLENPRQLIRWAYKADANSVSEIFELGDNYVIATIKTILEEGTSPFEVVRLDIERKVKNSKKEDYLISKMAEAAKGASSLQAIADKVNSTVSDASNVSFSAYSIPGVGFEPKIQGYLLAAEKDVISNPISGNTGVYVVRVTNINAPAKDAFSKSEKANIERSLQSRVSYQAYSAIKEAKEIIDRRSQFY